MIASGPRLAFEAGWNLIKLYFMIGHPTEEMEDVQAIIDLAKQVLAEGRKIHGKKASVNVGVSTFIPKPHTPFQWESMDDQAHVEEKLNLLRRELRGQGLRLRWNDPEESIFEGFLSRGDRRLAAVIESAWRKGAKFDAWADHFSEDSWREAMEEESDDTAEEEEPPPVVRADADLVIWADDTRTPVIEPLAEAFGTENGITAATYLFFENRQLSPRYLQATQHYLKRYTNLFGDYPFDGFAVVENFFPTGYGFPSFTLLGSRVLRLPFIPDTSLRHEVAHCWWGNGVFVDPAEGNWCEGLTTYMADYLSKEEHSFSSLQFSNSFETWRSY